MLKNIFIMIFTLALVSCSTASNLMSSNQVTTAQEYQVNEEGYWQGASPVIWERLSHTSLSSLQAAPTSNDDTINGWIKLAIISKTYSANSKDLTEQLSLWRKTYPNHPGNALIPAGNSFNNLSAPIPVHIALLLPLQGRTAAAGQAVRDGFLNAYYQSLAKTHIRQTISFYDTSNNRNISELYQRALASGADFVVGPLLKEDVEMLTRSGGFKVPTLELNYTDSSLPSNVWQFGLSSLDEAQQVADKAINTGHSKAIIIAPQNDWGTRNVKTFTNRFQAFGGTIIEVYYFQSNSNLSQDIAHLMHVNPKKDREQMKKENNKIVLEQQRRQDFNVIVLLAQPQSAREIVPLLKFYYADNIPIYATSSIYSGTPNPEKDRDLNGVIFSDIPWILENNQTNRLFAVGRDAYLLSSELSRLSKLPNFPLYASTGALTITSSNQIYRRLPWAKMHEGRP